MKFSHSQRALHEDNYNPPCNYYNLSSEQNTVLTGSLMGPSLVKQQPNFGLAPRFDYKKAVAPGPGDYFSENKKQEINGLVKTRAVVRECKRHGFLGEKERSPSIPYEQARPDKQDQQYIRQLLMNEDLNKSALATKKKSEGHTFSRSVRKINQQNAEKDEKQLHRIAQYSQKMIYLGLKNSRTPGKQQLRRANERREQIINMINPEFIPSLQLIEMITKRRTKFPPGPGFYDCEKSEKKQEQLGPSFSLAKRFSQDQNSEVGPGKYKIKEEKIKNVSLSKSARNLFNMKGETDLEHRFYIDPYSNIKKREGTISRGQSQPFSFGSQVARFGKVQKQVEVAVQKSMKDRRRQKIQSVVESRLQKLHMLQKRTTAESEGLLGLSTMASVYGDF